MRTILVTAALFSLLAVPAIALAPVPAPVERATDQESPAPPQLDAQSGLADSAALHTIGEFFTGGTIVETSRRLIGVRLQNAARSMFELPADEPARAALLKLREAERDRREIGDVLERDAAGATSFHTATPPPPTRA